MRTLYLLLHELSIQSFLFFIILKKKNLCIVSFLHFIVFVLYIQFFWFSLILFQFDIYFSLFCILFIPLSFFVSVSFNKFVFGLLIWVWIWKYVKDSIWFKRRGRGKTPTASVWFENLNDGNLGLNLLYLYCFFHFIIFWNPWFWFHFKYNVNIIENFTNENHLELLLLLLFSSVIRNY